MEHTKIFGPMLIITLILSALWVTPAGVSAHEPEFTRDFMLNRCGKFSTVGRNPFFILEPGYRLILAGEEQGAKLRVSISVLDQTKVVDGVRTRVVRERETLDGELVEISLNYFAICNRTNSVVYFGEDVDIYENGVIVSHEGSWRAGVDGARAGIVMPGTVLLGARYFQEIAPGVAMDRAEIMNLDAVVKTPLRTFKKCLTTRESTPLEPGHVEFKRYAPGVGLVQDGPVKLIEVSSNGGEEED